MVFISFLFLATTLGHKLELTSDNCLQMETCQGLGVEFGSSLARTATFSFVEAPGGQA